MSIGQYLTLTPVILFAVVSAANAKDEEPVGPTPAEIIENADQGIWRSTDPENLLYMDLPAGTVVIELRPDLAPNHVAQIRALTREGFYDGLAFHRVLEGFVAQGGDPKGDGTGGSDRPNINGEFARDTNAIDGLVEIGRDRIAPRIGFIDGVPVAAQPEALRAFKTDNSVGLWALHCPGMLSMARAADVNSANSQFFILIGDARLDLDRRYTIWGRIIDGFEATRRIDRGEPPPRPTPIMRMRVAADIPQSERKTIEIMRTDSEEFMSYIKARGDVDETGFVRDICDISVPVRINGEIER